MFIPMIPRLRILTVDSSPTNCRNPLQNFSRMCGISRVPRRERGGYCLRNSPRQSEHRLTVPILAKSSRIHKDHSVGLPQFSQGQRYFPDLLHLNVALPVSNLNLKFILTNLRPAERPPITADKARWGRLGSAVGTRYRKEVQAVESWRYCWQKVKT